MENIQKKVFELISKNCLLDIDPDRLSRETDLFNELNYDSITTVALIAEIEQTFGFSFDDEHLSFEVIGTCGAIVDYVKEMTNALKAGK